MIVVVVVTEMLRAGAKGAPAQPARTAE